MIHPNVFGLQKGVSATTAIPAYFSNLPPGFNTLMDTNSSTLSQTKRQFHKNLKHYQLVLCFHKAMPLTSSLLFDNFLPLN